MTSGIQVETKVHFTSGSHGQRRLHAGPTTAPIEIGRIPRITRMLALALRFERLLKEGTVTDQADLARLGHVTRARVTQIMNLLQLAPDIQESILFLPNTVRGKDPIQEHQIRPIAAMPDWGKQRQRWNSLKSIKYK